MDLFLPIVLFIVFCVLFSICGWCCKKHRQGTIYGFSGNPTVTVSTQPAASVIPPYPVSTHPVPQPGYPPTGGYQTAPYPVTTSPYPPAPAPGFYPMPIATYPNQYAHGNSGVAAPYPPHTSPYPPTSAAPYPPTSVAPYPPTNVAPYPPISVPYPAAQQPPSYTEAVSQAPPQPQQITTSYTKQSPYNPNY